jgi:hypothetical protein
LSGHEVQHTISGEEQRDLLIEGAESEGEIHRLARTRATGSGCAAYHEYACGLIHGNISRRN